MKKGDTIVTSSFSNIYPEGVTIGVVSEIVKSRAENFYDITVKLSTNYKNLEYVYVVGNLLKFERDSLESNLPIK